MPICSFPGQGCQRYWVVHVEVYDLHSTCNGLYNFASIRLVLSSKSASFCLVKSGLGLPAGRLFWGSLHTYIFYKSSLILFEHFKSYTQCRNLYPSVTSTLTLVQLISLRGQLTFGNSQNRVVIAVSRRIQECFIRSLFCINHFLTTPLLVPETRANAHSLHFLYAFQQNS